MKKNVFHRELLTSLRLATGKAKRAAKIMTTNQQQTLQGLAGTPFVTRGQGSHDGDPAFSAMANSQEQELPFPTRQART
jgi:hypothetical protein